MQSEVQPQEPLFYIGLLSVLLYFVYLVIMQNRQKAQKKSYLSHLKDQIKITQKQIQTTKTDLEKQLETRYSFSEVKSCFNQEMYKDMPIDLLKVGFGLPSDISYQGADTQKWEYSNYHKGKLVVHIWQDKVRNWQVIN
ncbi:hypothetical protein [Myroides sp. LJL119]